MAAGAPTSARTSAAARGPRWPGPRCGPHVHTGRRARSTRPASALMPAWRPVSPANHVVVPVDEIADGDGGRGPGRDPVARLDGLDPEAGDIGGLARSEL